MQYVCQVKQIIYATAIAIILYAIESGENRQATDIWKGTQHEHNIPE